MSEPHILAVFYNNPDQYPPIINSTRLLARAGYHVEVLCRDNGRQWNVSYPSETRVRRINTRSGGSWREYFGFVRQVLWSGNKHVVCFVGHDMHGLLPARLLASRYRRPLIYHCHDFADRSCVLPAGSRIVRAFEQRFARTADLVIVPDRERGVLMTQALQLSKPPLVVANAPIVPFDGSGSALLRALHEQKCQFTQILLRQGRIAVGHAIEPTLRSIPMWLDRTWGFVLMGVGEPSYIQSLLDLARELRVDKQFVILPPVGYDQLGDITPGAHVGHALYEPIHLNNVYISTASNKTMEYMAAGLPLLVSDRPALRKLIERFKCGVVADESSPESIAAAVNTLMSDRQSTRRLGTASRQAFEQVFCYERQFAPVLDVLDSMLTNGGRI